MSHAFGRRVVAPGGRSRLWLAGGLALAGWLVAAVLGFEVGPALAQTCGTVTIQNGTASPGSGTTAMTFVFAVRFVDSTGAAPQSVKVHVAEAWTTLKPSGSDYATGVHFGGSRKLPVGAWTYFFRATYGGGLTCDNVRVTPGAVTVGPVPTPMPTATPKPTPKPTPKATPRPTPKATARATTSTPSPKPIAQASAVPSSTPTAAPVAIVGAGSSPGTGDGSNGGGGGGTPGFADGPLTGGASLTVPLTAAFSAIGAGLLLLLARRRSRRDRSPVDGLAVDGGAMALEGATWGPPPILLPAAIFRELLYDPTEFTPVWLRPRPAPEPDPAFSSDPTVDENAVVNAAPTVEPKPAKRTRKPKASGSTGPAKTRSKRVAKPDQDTIDG